MYNSYFSLVGKLTVFWKACHHPLSGICLSTNADCCISNNEQFIYKSLRPNLLEARL